MYLPQTCEIGAEARRLNLREDSHTGYQRVLSQPTSELAGVFELQLPACNASDRLSLVACSSCKPDDWSYGLFVKTEPGSDWLDSREVPGASGPRTALPPATW